MMPRFFFNLVGSRPIADPSGLLRRDNEAAIEWGESIAEGLAKRRVSAVVIIYDQGGREVAHQITAKIGQLSGDFAARMDASAPSVRSSRQQNPQQSNPDSSCRRLHRSIRAPQPSHRELDLAVRQFTPGFHDGHVGRRRPVIENRPRPDTGLVSWQSIGFANEATAALGRGRHSIS